MAVFEVKCPITGDAFQFQAPSRPSYLQSREGFHGCVVDFDNAPNSLIYGYFRLDDDISNYMAPGLTGDHSVVHQMANEYGEDWENARSLGLTIRTLFVDYFANAKSRNPECDTSDLPLEQFLGLFCDQPDKLIPWLNDRMA